MTEAQVVRRYPRLRTDLAALYAAYYIAESLNDWTEDYDPHPLLFDEALDALNALGTELPAGTTMPIGLRIMRFEMVLLLELGYRPVLEVCALCETPVAPPGLAFSASAGGVLCRACQPRQRERRNLSPEAWRLLRSLAEPGATWNREWADGVRTEVRQVLGQYVTYLLGRRPRLLPYLGS